MKPINPSRRLIKAASDAVVEFALIAFEEEFLIWDKSVNLCTAELVWNAHVWGIDARDVQVAEPTLGRLVRTLMRARRVRWNTERFLVFELDVRHEEGEVLFSFRLTWDEGESFHPCEIAVDWNIACPAALN